MSKHELVKVDNDIQSLSISKLEKNEMKVFIKIMQIISNKLDQELTINFNAFREVLQGNYENINIGKIIDSSIKKIVSSYITIREKDKTIYFALFQRFVIDWKKEEILAKVNQEFLYLINNLFREYSVFNLNEVLNFKSKFSLLFYKKVREFFNKKTYVFTPKELFEFLGITEKQGWNFFNTKIKNIVEKELKNLFKNFEFVKEKKGKVITHLIIKW